jgi:DNA modification methylase
VIDIRLGDCLEVLRTIPDGSARMCVTSPPYYGLRNYGVDGQIGLEATPDAFVAKMVEVFREVRRVLADDGTCWLNLGDSYGAGLRTTQVAQSVANGNMRDVPESGRVAGFSKQLLGIPWRVAFALQADGWYLRSDIIWHKPNPMPESVRDRPTKAHEYVFLLSKQPRYYYDAEAVREEAEYGRRHLPNGVARTGRKATSSAIWRGAGDGREQVERNYGATGQSYDPSAGRNARTVWTITPRPFKGAHFATFPAELAERCITAGSSERGKCPECGAAWVRVVENESHSRWRDRKDPARLNGYGRKDCGGSVESIKPPTVTTIGWRPTCSHDLDPVPDVVLDPFAGAGTVGLVCQRLGRDHLGVELNPAYRRMAIDRIASDSPMPLLESVSG